MAADGIDYVLLYQLRERERPCCRCPAADHTDRGCRWCHGCTVALADHPAREEAEAVEAWRLAGSPLAMWAEGWRREDPPIDQSRPLPVHGEVGA